MVMKEDNGSTNKFFSSFPLRKYLKKEIIINAGESVEAVFFLHSGVARSYYVDENGSELTINLFKPLSVFPLTSVIAGKNNSYDFQAFTDIEVNIIPARDALRFLDKDRKFRDMMLQKFASGLEGYLIRSFFLIKGNAMQKVASTLLMLVKRFGGKMNRDIIDLPLTHQDIADISGTTRETASIQIEKLEKDGAIMRKGRYIIVRDYKKLNERATVGEESNLFNLSF